MYKIFMVEDDIIVSEIYRHMIETEGYFVQIANDSETACDKIKTFQPDLLLLDMMMPGLSGADLLKMLRADPEFEKLPIFAFSGAGSDEILEEAKHLGATDVLSKPEFTPARVVTKITEALSHHAVPQQKAFHIQPPAEKSSSEMQGREGRVLVIEDDPVVTEFVKTVMEEENYEVVSAADGREAYKILNADSDFVAGIFDMNIPFIEGHEIIRHMKTEKRLMKIPILVMTADESLGAQSKSFSAGAAMFISKPFTRASLKMMFRTIINGTMKN